MGIVMAVCTSEGATARQRPQPDIAALISPTEVASMAKNAVLCVEAEKWLAEILARDAADHSPRLN